VKLLKKSGVMIIFSLLGEALESSHAVWGAVELAKQMRKDQNVVIVSFLSSDRDLLMMNLMGCFGMIVSERKGR
jgi:tryptophan synthase beta subunit